MAKRTLVMLAHHDAAQTGRLFDQRLQRKIHKRFPGFLRRFKTQQGIALERGFKARSSTDAVIPSRAAAAEG